MEACCVTPKETNQHPTLAASENSTYAVAEHPEERSGLRICRVGERC